ncbi:MAG: nitrous oxide-stimulated promoter family protein [Coriobacteriia bacterium]|nr:nitrous oxide-stimulated promoter family protein [Coriobacteriia bacterium]MBS5477382.1 nitrous oxide-stimulated promoter family protein [Coriobacteriia bacterium]
MSETTDAAVSAFEAQQASAPTPQEKRRAKVSERLQDPEIARDCRTLGGMVQIWCADHHDDALRVPYSRLGTQEGIYEGHKPPRLCPDCAAHLEYGEMRRALCPNDPKPSCHLCEIHCYKPDERAWQRQVMAYAGPRAMFRGMFFDALHHLRQEARGSKALRARKATSHESRNSQ